MLRQDTSCLYSTVLNSSGQRINFGFLPPHGRVLQANESYTIFGNVQEAVIRGDRAGAKRNMVALEAAIERGDLEIIESPGVFMYDQDDLVAKQLILRNGALVLVDPCWTSLSLSI